MDSQKKNILTWLAASMVWLILTIYRTVNFAGLAPVIVGYLIAAFCIICTVVCAREYFRKNKEKDKKIEDVKTVAPEPDRKEAEPREKKRITALRVDDDK